MSARRAKARAAVRDFAPAPVAIAQALEARGRHYGDLPASAAALDQLARLHAEGWTTCSRGVYEQLQRLGAGRVDLAGLELAGELG